MAQCSNCQSQLSCGCQRRTASNGVQVCANCLSKYEEHLAALKNNQNLNKNK